MPALRALFGPILVLALTLGTVAGAQSVCGLVAAILPHGFVPAARAAAAFLPVPGRTAASAPRSTDPPPPRTSVLS